MINGRVTAPSDSRLGRLRGWMEARAAWLSRALPPPPFMGPLSQVESMLADQLLVEHAVSIERARQAFAISIAARHPPPRREARASRSIPRGAGGVARRRTAAGASEKAARAARHESDEGGATKGDADTAALEAVAEQLVSELRARMECLPWDRPLLGLVARTDQKLPTDADEHMDDQALPPDVRRRLVATLEKQTRNAGDYLVLADLFLSDLPSTRGKPLTVLDLGSGSGGFPISVARAAAGRPLRLVASDVDPEYLALGARGARDAGVLGISSEGPSVEFRRLDAFHLLRELGEWRPDVITCTRTLHHLGVKGTARILALSLQAADAIFFVDIARSISRLVMAAGAGLFSGNRHFAHDAVVSVRKAFTPVEMRLICACVPGAEELEIFYTAPAYLVARGSRGRRAAAG